MASTGAGGAAPPGQRDPADPVGCAQRRPDRPRRFFVFCLRALRTFWLSATPIGRVGGVKNGILTGRSAMYFESKTVLLAWCSTSQCFKSLDFLISRSCENCCIPECGCEALVLVEGKWERSLVDHQTTNWREAKMGSGTSGAAIVMLATL